MEFSHALQSPDFSWAFMAQLMSCLDTKHQHSLDLNLSPATLIDAAYYGSAGDFSRRESVPQGLKAK